MNICLICAAPSPDGDQSTAIKIRLEQATALTELGHHVYLIGSGLAAGPKPGPGGYLYDVSLPEAPLLFSASDPVVDRLLTYSQLVYEAVAQLARQIEFDLVDSPLAEAAGLVTAIYHQGPVVFTALAQSPPDNQTICRLERECLERAAGLIHNSDLTPARLKSRYGTIPALTYSLRPPLSQNGRSLAGLADFYRQVCQAYRQRSKRARRVYQVGDALDYGDAVSNIMRRNANLLADMGQAPFILAKYAHEAVAAEATVFHPARVRADDGLIFHYWNYSELEDFLSAYRGPKALYYHNLTPPHYFPPHSRHYEMSRRGQAQLARIADEFDLLIGDSNFNLTELDRFLTRPKPTLWIPPVIDAPAIRAAPFDEGLWQQLRAAAQVNFLFVGRVAPNKRQDQIMRLFDSYYREINHHSRLYLVGDYDHTPEYFQNLEDLRRTLPAGDHIVFSGKVPDEAVPAYYRAADVFVSASEHEGFGVPLLEAMVHDVPVLALASSAVPETMGRAGILIQKWDIPRLAELINLLLKEEAWQARLLAAQRQNLKRFTLEEGRRRLAAAVDFLVAGKRSSYIASPVTEGKK